MNMSFSGQPGFEVPLPVSAFPYRDVAGPGSKEKQSASANTAHTVSAAPGLQPHEVEVLLARARSEASAETQKRLQAGADAEIAENNAKVVRALELFQTEQKNYFSRLESEVVQLALTISARILHREAQVDPMLVAGLVHVALEKLQNGSSVSVRVAPEQAERWREYTADLKKDLTISVIADAQIGPKDCVLETNLGSADFSIDAQLKEVEKGFFDLLALRPQGQ